MLIHTYFDFIASFCSATVTYLCYRWRLRDAAQQLDSAGPIYALSLVLGAAVGGYGFGTLNLWLGGVHEMARSIVGALAGAIFAIEVFKRLRGIKGSTGLIFVPAFATTVVVGRWGCFFAGLQDETYGTPSTLPWAVDLGDGVLRHPVQLYESFAMLAFLLATVALLARRNAWFMANGFYAMVIYYGCQRFCWEFLKPYAPLFGPFNLFHVVCAVLIAYAFVMLSKSHERTVA